MGNKIVTADKGYYKMNEDDLKMVRPICQSFLINHNHESLKIQSKDIIANMKKCGYLLSDSKLRKIIGYIRSNNLLKPYFILSDTTGYWATDNHKEMDKFYKSMRFRAMNILSNIKPIHYMLKGVNDIQLEMFSDESENV